MSLQITDLLLDAAPCGYLSLADDGTMVAVNTTLTLMLGYKRVELEGWHVQRILPPGARIFYDTHVFPILRMHGKAEEIYIALRSRDGDDIPMLMNAIRRERDGRFISDAVFVRMIQRHAYEDQLLQARRTAEEASAAKAKFLSMMSHDLRTPLTAISGLAELLLTGFHGPVTRVQEEELRHIRGAARELGQLLDDILSFVQLDSGKVKVHQADVAVADAVARAQLLMRFHAQQSDLSLLCACDEGDVVSADPDRLQQILLNLLTNALKFTPPGGSVTISSEHRDDRVLIHVRDTGVGIESGQLEKIFDAFVQLEPPQDETQRGVGLGLAICRELARAMGGDVTAASTPGVGSVFTIDLPAALNKTVA
ncbi:MAG: HAMP domain-containing histidine kinase [Acidobacteriota bacterium]|nr:HAMP domain-containing histidine kinase [Acidobacteriota bacterium]